MNSIPRIVLSIPFLIWPLSAYSAIAATIHVPASQPTIQDGIDEAVDGDLVLVAPGTYVENIDFLGKAIRLQSSSGAAVTVIDGNEAGSVVLFTSDETMDAAIDGFTITNGLDVQGGGIACKAASPMIVNCIISKNVAGGGGGISCYYYSCPTIENCTISQNLADYSGGGGIYCTRNSNPPMKNCTITGNNSTWGGGISIEESAPTVTNCILWGNIAVLGFEILLWSHTTCTVSYSNVQGGTSGVHTHTGAFLDWREGNINSNPLFVGDGDYHIRTGSPCIDTGTNAGVYADIDGDSRPQGAGFDMGSDEAVPTGSCSILHAPASHCLIGYSLIPILALIIVRRYPPRRGRPPGGPPQ